MPGWLGFALLVGVVLVAIAPRQTLGPVFGWTQRLLGAGVIAVLALSVGGYLMLRGGLSEQERWMAFAALGLGGVCAAWWIYRRFVPAYRDQSAPEPD